MSGHDAERSGGADAAGVDAVQGAGADIRADGLDSDPYGLERANFDEGAWVSVPFEGRWERGAERFEFEFGVEDTQVVGEFRTQEQALWCRDQVVVELDGVVGSGRPGTAELVSDDILEGSACDPSTFPDGSPGPGYGNGFGFTALCSNVTFRSFYADRGFNSVYIELFDVAPIEFSGYSFVDRYDNGVGNAAQPPAGDTVRGGAGSNAPTDSTGGLYYYGDIPPDQPALREDPDVEWDEASQSVNWVFRNPPGQTEFTFRGRVVVQMVEVCDGVDNDCDGYVDEGAQCFGSGVACRVDADCGVDMGGNQLQCVDNGSGQLTCGGALTPEDCDQNVDENGNGLPGCEDPTCSGVAPCPDFACVDGNAAGSLSEIDGDYVRFGTTAPGDGSDFTLPVGQLACGSRFAGAERAFLWTAPLDGEYTFATDGSTMDTALIVVPGGCPVDIAAAFANGDAQCADEYSLESTGESIVLSMTAGQTVTVIVDSAIPSTLAFGSGGWALSVFKTPECGDGLTASTDRFGNSVEFCDDVGFSATCDDDCSAVECGDGVVNPVVEECEDGGVDDGDGCSSGCLVEVGYVCDAAGCYADCGDGLIIEGAEGCDDGNNVSGDGCPVDCSGIETGWNCAVAGVACEEICGDGIVVGSEVCDSPSAPGCSSCSQVDSGYVCPPEGGDCSDIDECAEGGGGCSVNGECNNIPGGYFCTCLPGYRGDGLQCDDINECDPGDAWFVVDGNPYTANGGCDPNAQCSNTEGGVSCACNAGYTGTGTTCDDIDECTVGLPSGDEACDALVVCTNLPGSYSCGACPDGYAGDGDTGCTPMECLDPGNPSNGAQVGTYTSYVLGTEVLFECNSGYVATGGDAARTCVPDGGAVGFDGTMLVCDRRPCGAPPALADASISNPQPGWVYEDVANYSCASGFVPTGGVAPFATCQSDGSFSAVVSSCERIDCGTLTAPAFGSVDISGGTVFGDVATYTCDSGYRAVGATARTCGPDGVWSAGAPSCERITCTPPTPPANAQLSGGPYEYVSGETVTFACDEGYEASGSLSQTCQLDGNYSAIVGSCALVDCGALAAPSNGTMSGSGTTYLSERTFGCDGGYTATGAATRVCQANGQWSGTPFACTDCNANPGEPECSSLDCGPAPEANDGRSTLSSVSSTFLTGQATYTCDASSTTNGAPAGGTTYIRSCQSAGPTGAWSLPTATCQEVDCGPLAGSGALSVSAPDTTVDGVATYSCGVGTRLAGSATRTCTASGWSGTAPTCTTLTCPAPTPVTGGLVTPTSGGNALASTATHSCNSAAGYVAASGTTTQTCVDDGDPVATAGAWQWGGAPLTCALRECGDYDVANSTESAINAVGPNGRSVGTVISFACDSGYVVEGTSVSSVSRTCGTDGQWTGGLPVCVRRACDALPGAPGSVSGAATYSHPAGYATPVSTTTATYTCASGSRIGGSPTGGTTASATCGDSGTWTAWSGTCQTVSCGNPPVAAPGSNSSRDAGWDASAGGTAVYSCNPGFSINGAASAPKSYTATCVDGTGWQLPVDSICEPFVCDALSNVSVAGGTAAVVSYQTAAGVPTASRAFGHRAIYNRQTGYRLLSGSTSTVRTCQADGTWSGIIPTYERMQCPVISATSLTTTYRTDTNAVTSNRYVGYTASFACTISGLAPTTGTQTCRETTETNVRWEVPLGTGAPSVTCGNVNECAVGNACGEDTDARNTCTDRTPTASSGPGATRFECGCSAANGWGGAAVANAPATCDGVCGDGLVRGTEVCDDGAWNDRPWTSISGPGTPHPRYGSDCEGVECDCTGPNASTTPSCISSGARTVCLDNGIPAAGLAAADCRAASSFTAGRCSDGLDTDGDGRTDCADPGCSGKATCPNWNEPGCRHDYFLGNAQGLVGQYTLTNDVNVSPDRFNVGFGSQEDVSFLWQAPFAGDWVFETCSGVRSFDTVMGAYSTNTCSSGGTPNLAANDDADASKGTRLGCSVVVVRAEQNEPITVVVSAFGGNAGGTFPMVIYPSVDRSCGNGIVDAPIGLGVAATNRRVPDARITASSYWVNDAGHAPWLGRLFQTGTPSNWSAGANNLSQWWQVDFQAPVTIGAVATQGRSTAGTGCPGDGCGQRVTEYRVQWSNDGVNFTTVNNSRSDLHNPANPALFPGNWDQDTVRYNYFAPVTARYWRIVPTGWVNHITMRAEFFTHAEWCDDGNTTDGDGCSASCVVEPNSSCFGGSPSACVSGAQFTCGDGVVETQGAMYGPTRPDSAFTAANWWQFNDQPVHAPAQGRIDGPTAWAFAQGASVGTTWWQMDLGSPQPVAGAVTQGRADWPQWVTRYQVAYSNDGSNFTFVEGGRVFTGNNSQGATRVFNRWATITARYWRIYPTEFYGHMSMRADFFAPRYGYGHSLPDSAFTAQSWWPNSQPGDAYAAHRGRLENVGIADDAVWHPGSGVDPSVTPQWWQLDLGSPRPVGSVGTRGRANYDQWTSSYRVGYSNDGTNFTFVEGGRVFAGNTNSHDVVFNGWAPINARYWRIYPVTWSWVPVLRADFFPALEVCDDGNLTNGDGCNSFCQVEENWRCYGQPSICGGRRTVFNVGGLSGAANDGWFGFWWAGGSYGAPSDWRMGPYTLNSCDTITGIETFYTFAYPHYQASDLVSWVHNGSTTNELRGDGWFPIRQAGNNYRTHPSYEEPGYALSGGSTPSTMMNGRNGNSSAWYTQMSDYATAQGTVGGDYGARMNTMRLDVYCRCLSALTWYRDADGDGFGNPAAPLSSCAQPNGYVSNNLDCDDGNGGITRRTYYRDNDRDGWTTNQSTTGCSAPSNGWVERAAPTSPLDCNDNTQWIYPGRTEICDGADNDCNGSVDESTQCYNAHRAPSTNSGGAGCVGRFNTTTNRGYMLCHANSFRTRDQHRQRCQHQGMDLALPNDQTENEWLRDTMRTWRNFGVAWIGVEWRSNAWRWIANDSVIPWGNTGSNTSANGIGAPWRSGEPNGGGELCVELTRDQSGGTSRRWNDISCGESRNESFCEWNSENNTSP